MGPTWGLSGVSWRLLGVSWKPSWGYLGASGARFSWDSILNTILSSICNRFGLDCADLETREQALRHYENSIFEPSSEFSHKMEKPRKIKWFVDAPRLHFRVLGGSLGRPGGGYGRLGASWRRSGAFGAHLGTSWSVPPHELGG